MLKEEFVKNAPEAAKARVVDVYERLLVRYSEPHRFYHTLKHLEYGMAGYKLLYDTPLTRTEFFAWMYHDAVYDPHASDNEEKSTTILLYDYRDLGLTVGECDAACSLILGTNPTVSEGSGVVSDMDLTILGATPEVYDEYTANIRKEYNWVTPEVWKSGRTAVLKQLLTRDQLYSTLPFQARYTSQAIENVAKELWRLETE